MAIIKTDSRQAFTLIELLVSIGIIALLTTLLVTNVNRSLSKNRLAETVDVLSAKIDQARLLAGSRGINDPLPNLNTPTDQAVGFYAIYLPKNVQSTEFKIIKVSSPIQPPAATGTHPCTLPVALTSPDCLVEAISFGRGVTLKNNSAEILLAFRVPTQQFVGLFCDPASDCTKQTSWRETSGVAYRPTLSLAGSTKNAKLSFSAPTGKISVVYNN